MTRSRGGWPRGVRARTRRRSPRCRASYRLHASSLRAVLPTTRLEYETKKVCTLLLLRENTSLIKRTGTAAARPLRARKRPVGSRVSAAAQVIQTSRRCDSIYSKKKCRFEGRAKSGSRSREGSQLDFRNAEALLPRGCPSSPFWAEHGDTPPNLTPRPNRSTPPLDGMPLCLDHIR